MTDVREQSGRVASQLRHGLEWSLSLHCKTLELKRMATGKTNALALCNSLMQTAGFMRRVGFVRRANFSRTNPGVPSQT